MTSTTRRRTTASNMSKSNALIIETIEIIWPRQYIGM